MIFLSQGHDNLLFWGLQLPNILFVQIDTTVKSNISLVLTCLSFLSTTHPFYISYNFIICLHFVTNLYWFVFYTATYIFINVYIYLMKINEWTKMIKNCSNLNVKRTLKLYVCMITWVNTDNLSNTWINTITWVNTAWFRRSLAQMCKLTFILFKFEDQKKIGPWEWW